MDMTKIDQPFGTLDIETKLALHRAFYEGKVIEVSCGGGGRFGACSAPRFIEDVIYRLRPEPLRDIMLPWAALDARWQWAALDEDGQVWVYTEKPEASHNYWAVNTGECWRIDGLLVGVYPGNKPWSESLIRRPEGV